MPLYVSPYNPLHAWHIGESIWHFINKSSCQKGQAQGSGQVLTIPLFDIFSYQRRNCIHRVAHHVIIINFLNHKIVTTFTNNFKVHEENTLYFGERQANEQKHVLK